MVDINPAALVSSRPEEKYDSIAFICPDDTLDIHSVQRRPTPEERVIIDEYRRRFQETFAYWPHGIHYLPEFPTAAVWFPATT